MFIADVDRLESQFKTEGATLPLVIQTNQTLVAWLIRHINRIDTEFAAYLHQKGVVGS